MYVDRLFRIGLLPRQARMTTPPTRQRSQWGDATWFFSSHQDLGEVVVAVVVVVEVVVEVVVVVVEIEVAVVVVLVLVVVVVVQVEPHEAVAEVSKIGNVQERFVVVSHSCQSENIRQLFKGPTH